MANFVLLDQAIHVGAYDLTTHSNQVSLTQEVETQDNTTFGGGGFRSRKGGLRNVELEASGFHDADPSTAGFTRLGVVDEVITLHPGAQGDVTYTFQGTNFKYDTLGSVGEMNPYSLSAACSNGDGLFRGLLAKVRGTVSAAGQVGTVFNLGAPAGRELFAVIHVFSAGTSMSVQLESDDNSDFTSATGVFNVAGGNITTIGAHFRSLASSTTDTWFRLNATACTGTFTVAAAIGVQ